MTTRIESPSWYFEARPNVYLGTERLGFSDGTLSIRGSDHGRKRRDRRSSTGHTSNGRREESL